MKSILFIKCWPICQPLHSINRTSTCKMSTLIRYDKNGIGFRGLQIAIEVFCLNAIQIFLAHSNPWHFEWFRVYDKITIAIPSGNCVKKIDGKCHNNVTMNNIIGQKKKENEREREKCRGSGIDFPWKHLEESTLCDNTITNAMNDAYLTLLLFGSRAQKPSTV